MAELIPVLAVYIDPEARTRTPCNQEVIRMSAESDALNEQIRQSVGLLRRHL